MKTQQVFGYVRVSSRGQATDDRDGIPRQKEAIWKWAMSSGARVVRWFEDSVSGTKDLEHRPAFSELVATLQANGTRTVVIERLDRLARDLMVQESILADLKRNGFELISVAEPDLCSDDPTRKLTRQILGAFAEYERAMLVLKLRGARQRARAKDPSRHEGRKPFGAHPGERDSLNRMHALHRDGAAYAMIANTLNDERRPPRMRGARWHANSVRRVLMRDTTKLASPQNRPDKPGRQSRC
jgi:DNA invertase Pin-like site-specific DNA recombinase